MSTVLIILVLLLIFGAFPYGGTAWHGAGYYPSGLGGILLIVLVVCLLTGRL